jgi:hypothetical protein
MISDWQDTKAVLLWCRKSGTACGQVNGWVGGTCSLLTRTMKGAWDRWSRAHVRQRIVYVFVICACLKREGGGDAEAGGCMGRGAGGLAHIWLAITCGLPSASAEVTKHSAE